MKYQINNKERETIHRIAHNALKWQQNNICKFCYKTTNTIEHILIYCEPIKQIWQEYEKLIKNNQNIQIKLNKDNILYNFFDLNLPKLTTIIKDLTFLKMNVIKQKKELDKQKICNWNNSKFQKHLLEIINTKHKESKSETDLKINYR